MAILSKEEAKALLEKALSYSKADECEVNLGGSIQGNIRYARNTVTTAGIENNVSMVIQSSFGKKSGTVTLNEFTADKIASAVKRSEELAQLAPENPEYMGVLGPQDYKDTDGFVEATANISAEYRADVALSSIKPAKGKDITAAGFFNDSAGFSSKMTSKGLFGYTRSTDIDFTVTMRTNDGTGSGWAGSDFNDVTKFNAETASQIALEKALRSKEAKAIEPGKYTVILEPAASVGLLRPMLFSMAARSADEGRSFLTKKGGGNKLGEKIVDERVNIYSDPWHPEVPANPWSGDGLPVRKTDWIENGVVKNMTYDRYWASQKNVEPVPFAGGVVMQGGTATLEDMIRDTERGVLVTRLWYIRAVDPQTLLYTGLTRDGTFYIEDGMIKYPVKNFRFNESPVIMLNNLETLGRQTRVNGSLIPLMKIRDFTFSSLSDAV